MCHAGMIWEVSYSNIKYKVYGDVDNKQEIHFGLRIVLI